VATSEPWKDPVDYDVSKTICYTVMMGHYFAWPDGDQRIRLGSDCGRPGGSRDHFKSQTPFFSDRSLNMMPVGLVVYLESKLL
jgi:hypothetical protein